MFSGYGLILELLTCTALAAWACALVLSWRGLWGGARLAGWAGVLAMFGVVAVLVWQLNRLPLMGMWEIISQTALILGFLGAAAWGRPGGRPAALWSWGGCLVILGLMLMFSSDPSPDSFMYDYPWLILFFQGRIWCMALLLFGGAQCLAAPAGARGAGKRFLLAGFTAFLLSEFSGACWSFNWTGQFWHWSRGFLESSLLFMLLAVPLHLPRSWAVRPAVSRVAGILPGAAVLVFTLLRQLG